MPKSVLVLGGGVAGMSAAHELVERGFTVEVHEPRQMAGGKARSIPVPQSGVGGRPDLPGEHGFRFFPGFYRHLPDTMKRIPFGRQRLGVYDNLVQASQFLLSGGPRKSFTYLVRFPRTPAQWRELLSELADHRTLDIPQSELAFFVGRLLTILTTCKQRRLAEYEKIDWWQFIAAEGKSEAYQRYLAIGLTRCLVALKAQEASTRTVGDILIQLLLGIYSPFVAFDRVLNGPTSEVWIDPWLSYLESRGVRYRRGSRLTAIGCGGDGRISGVTVENAASVSEERRADYYLLALPVEALVPLLTEPLRRAEPRLCRLTDLRVAWMNGLQLFLRRDLPLVNGHADFATTPSALTAISQGQFFRRPLREYGDGSANGCLSIDISNWESPGPVARRPLHQLTSSEEVMREVQAQLKAVLPPELATRVDDDNLVCWFLDSDITFPNPSPTVNLEPLLINTDGSWQNRPDAVTAIDNLFLAGDYVRTYTDLATMEGANESARRAVNGILAAARSSAAPCRLWPLGEPLMFAPARLFDLVRFKLGLPHIGLGRPVAKSVPAIAPPRRRVAVPLAAAMAEPPASYQVMRKR
jgi:uncharacterized protein with NAD-binding domain and iron-sulfur cluster